MFEVIIHVKHFDETLFKSLQSVNSLSEAELIGLGMRHGAAMCLEEIWGVEDLTATIEECRKPDCECNCHCGGWDGAGICKQPCDKCSCLD
jgi:hypothetical protein